MGSPQDIVQATLVEVIHYPYIFSISLGDWEGFVQAMHFLRFCVVYLTYLYRLFLLPPLNVHVLFHLLLSSKTYHTLHNIIGMSASYRNLILFRPATKMASWKLLPIPPRDFPRISRQCLPGLNFSFEAATPITPNIFHFCYYSRHIGYFHDPI